MSGLFNVPEHALTAWLDLHEQILGTGATPCAGRNRDEWTGKADQQARAAAACLDCPAMTACAEYAEVAGETTGVWGGLTPTERKRRGAA